MSEQTMRSRVARALKRHDPRQVENSVGPGTPDTNFVEGWLELKWVRRAPARAETPVTIHHFTSQQRVWLSRRARAGGNVWLLLQVGQVWLLFHGGLVPSGLGRTMNIAELWDAAHAKWGGGLDDKEFRDIVTLKCKDPTTAV